jgi:large subunit ribosomal protein L2
VGVLVLDYWLGFVRVWQTCLAGWFAHRGCPTGLVVDESGSIGFLKLSLGVTRGMYIHATTGATLPKLGSTLCLRWVPVGTLVNSVGTVGRAPGVAVKVLRHRNNFTECRLPSRKTCWISSLTLCRVGQQGNDKVKYLSYKKAGQNFWLGNRPSVRGVAMNPIDHPHGGGQGKTSGGRPGVTPWGRLTKGARTVLKKR